MKIVICRIILTVFLMVGAVQGYAAVPLKIGQCSLAGDVRAALSAEGQNPIIVGNRTGYGYATALIFMANADGSRGYLVRGDKPLGEQASTICIDSVFTDVRLNDISKPGLPAWAKFGGDREEALRVCKRDRLGYQEVCMFHDEAVLNLDSHGDRVMLTAKGAAINPRDKTVRSGQVITVTLNPGKQSGLITATTSEGARYSVSAYTKASYSQYGEKLLAAGRY